MYLSAFLHRDSLFQITNRWLSDRLHENDALQVSKIITYDSFAAWETLLSFTQELLSQLYEEPVEQISLSSKKELKDYICQSGHKKSKRVKKLIKEYKKMPEFYYVGSPLTGYIYQNQSGEILGICRFKRLKRIAEKASRYAKLYILDRVENKSRKLLKKKGKAISLSDSIPHEVFLEAEKQEMRRIKKYGLHLPIESMTIKDILGIKLIDNGFGEEGLETALQQNHGIKIVEKERHSGHYNAIHYIVEKEIRPNDILKNINLLKSKSTFKQRGFAEKNSISDFYEFLTNGADNVQIDLILTSYDELIESEIGRSMHETRIFEQREQQRFHGNILTNIEYIIEFLFAVGLSPKMSLNEIPIKIWGRYLPDTLGYRIRELYHMPEHSLLFS